MADAPPPCNTNLDLVGFKFPLPHLAQSLKRQRKTRIVAVGSSSTAGEGNIIPYPARLELALRGHSYGRMVDVLNRGLGGQEAPEELARFEPDVIGEAPALVIWQVGTNAVFHDEVYSPDAVAAAIAAGLDWLAGLPLDVVLMDLQYTTAIVKPEKIKRAQDILSRIEAAAAAARVSPLRPDGALGCPGRCPDRRTDRSDRWRPASHERLGHQLHESGAFRRDRGRARCGGLDPGLPQFPAIS